MAEVQEGVQVLFDQFESSVASSDDSTSSSQSQPRDYHQEQYPSYVPPHKRGHNTQQDKFVNFKATKAGEADKKEGVENDKYQRLEIPVPFALDRDKMMKLKADFPGVYFHCRDNGNHDHPFSHMVTMIGTRFMQRRIKPGSKILDVYGNPIACDRFNASQVAAPEPKFMKALVHRVGPTDFIREVNKWGPFFDNETGEERYHRGPLKSMISSGEIEEYDVLHLTHTLYYIPFEELSQALHAPGKKKRVAYALIHKHKGNEGSINDGEQHFQKKWVGGSRLVRQVNTATNSAYVHPDLTDILFRQDKVWLPEGRNACRGEREQNATKGLAWEVHIVNSETWIVEFVPYEVTELDGVVDYAELWDMEESLSTDDPLTTPDSADGSIQVQPHSVIIPASDGRFVELEIPCKALFDRLRMRCSGKERTPKLLEELISTANHLVDPSALFGQSTGMRCPPDKIYDVAVAAFTADIPKEALITGEIGALRSVLTDHARKRSLGPKFKDFSLRDVMSMLRVSLQGMRDVNRVVRAKDPLDVGIEHVQSYLT